MPLLKLSYYLYCKTMFVERHGVNHIFVNLYLADEGLKQKKKDIRALKNMFWFP